MRYFELLGHSNSFHSTRTIYTHFIFSKIRKENSLAQKFVNLCTKENVTGYNLQFILFDGIINKHLPSA